MPPKKILVVDDHVDTRVICRELFTHYGYEVLEASDGIEAVDVAFTHLPDLILMDFLMPNADGAETIRQLRAHAALANTRIVLYTAAATQLDELQKIEGMDGVLVKPLEVRFLIKLVESLLGAPQVRP